MTPCPDKYDATLEAWQVTGNLHGRTGSCYFDSANQSDFIGDLECGESRVDPFDQQPLRYSRKNKRVYSVGRNLEDEGGHSEREGHRDEPTWFIDKE